MLQKPDTTHQTSLSRHCQTLPDGRRSDITSHCLFMKIKLKMTRRGFMIENRYMDATFRRITQTRTEWVIK